MTHRDGERSSKDSAENAPPPPKSRELKYKGKLKFVIFAN